MSQSPLQEALTDHRMSKAAPQVGILTMAPPGCRIAALRQQEPSLAGVNVLEEEFLGVFTTGAGAKTTLSEEIYRRGQP